MSFTDPFRWIPNDNLLISKIIHALLLQFSTFPVILGLFLLLFISPEPKEHWCPSNRHWPTEFDLEFPAPRAPLYLAALFQFHSITLIPFFEFTVYLIFIPLWIMVIRPACFLTNLRKCNNTGTVAIKDVCFTIVSIDFHVLDRLGRSYAIYNCPFRLDMRKVLPLIIIIPVSTKLGFIQICHIYPWTWGCLVPLALRQGENEFSRFGGHCQLPWSKLEDHSS